MAAKTPGRLAIGARPRLRRAAALGLAATLLVSCAPAGPASAPKPAASAAGSPPQSATPVGGPSSSSAPAASGPAATALSAPIPARTGYPVAGIPTAPFWMALEGGYFREQGLDGSVVLIGSGAPMLAALSNREIDVAFAGGAPLVLGYLQGLETLIIGSTNNIMDNDVYVRPEIQSADALRGRTIGITRLKSLSDVAGRLALQRLGLQPDADVFLQPTGGPSETIAAMEAGVVDGGLLTVPQMFEAQKRGYRKLLSIVDFRIAYLQGGFGATRGHLSEQPELGSRYLRAMAQAMSRLQIDRDFSIQVADRYIPGLDREVLNAALDYFLPLYQPDLYPDAEAVQAVLDLEENPAARTTRPADVTDARYADQLRGSGFLSQLPR
jgi:ABC-type nitrate/sulfonate/bicarbonate transport system substrate-binding protein